MVVSKPKPRSIADALATEIMETVPYIMYFIRTAVRRNEQSVLSIPQIRVLAFIDKCPGSSLSRLSESLGVTGATASTMVDRLVKAGLVERSADPVNRRNIILRLTRSGEAQLLANRRVAISALAAELDKLSKEDAAKVEEALLILQGVFREAGSRQDSRPDSRSDSQQIALVDEK
jgi:DNA-binding MarR family transcriptional regulator